MLARVLSGVILGIEGQLIEVEVDLGQGLPSFDIVGLPDPAVRESRERVRSAIKNSGYPFPLQRITINLAPADIKKVGPHFDLAIALGILASQGIIKERTFANFLFLGELSLTGSIRKVKGVLPLVIAAREKGLKGVIIPRENYQEAVLVEDIKIIPVNSLQELILLLQRGSLEDVQLKAAKRNLGQNDKNFLDFKEVKGQYEAKRALEIAAAGGHNVLMVGPPGSGKTMLAKSFRTILPPLTKKESLEVSKIYSIAGLWDEKSGLLSQRPFRAPHHSISVAGLIGGGKIPEPGEISLAHFGVLFLDELTEFHKDVLNMLRQPLEEGTVSIVRRSMRVTFPADFILIAAMNPCPCGYYGDELHECHCTPREIERYRSRVSGPLLDRIDIHIEVPALRADEITGDDNLAESSAQIRERVIRAHERQKARYRKEGITFNAQLKGNNLKRYCYLDEDCKILIKEAINKLGLSARAYDKVLKVARTIADLAGAELINTAHLAEAIQYRSVDK